ncbi:MAG TPA: tetratricopeptide repeat protein [Thermoanaerobaculia bacterium]|nr:tetratricopeptide repeat protein [Thermoanaerobaculia bacterium]
MPSSTPTRTVARLLLALTAGAAQATAQGGAGSPAPALTPGLPAPSVTAGPPASALTPALPVIYVESPREIDLADYLAAWPGLEPYVARLRRGERDAVKAQLQSLASAPTPSDGALNLLAQLEREDGRLDAAEALGAHAIRLNPREHRHHFQQAMIFFARLAKASGLERWLWHQRTRDAYQRAFDLDPRPVPYRYYLVYSLLHTPAFAGGDKAKAQRLAQDGIDLGQKEFLVVRADVQRVRGDDARAFADYDRAMADRVFNLTSFLAGGQRALEKGDRARAQRYYVWAIRCRPDSARAHEGVGDSYAAAGDGRAAAAEYAEALRLDPRSTSAREKLGRSGAAPVRRPG